MFKLRNILIKRKMNAFRKIGEEVDKAMKTGIKKVEERNKENVIR